MTAYLLQDRPHPGVLLLTLNRPERKNPLDRHTTLALVDALLAANADPETRAIVLTGAGGNFCSGGDLADFADLASRSHPPPGQRLMETLNECAKPVIAAIEGIAVGGAVTMLLHFDLVYAAQGARFLLPFVNLGTCPEGGSSYYLPLVAGYRKAAELLMLGEFFDVARAEQAGLVTQATADGQALQQALASARTIASKSTESMRLTKMLMREGQLEVMRRVLAREHGLFTERLHLPEVQATIAAMMRARKEKN